MADRNTLKKYYNQCREYESLQLGDPRYVDFDSRGLRGPCCRKELVKRILLEDGFSHQLFSGFKGGGKTTELYGLKHDLEEQGYVVIYGDAKEYLNLTMPISTGEVLLSLAGVFDAYLEENLDKSLRRESYWERAVNFMQSEVKIEEFGIDAPGVGIKAALKENPTFKNALQEFLGKRLQQFKSETDGFIQEAIALAKKDYRSKKKTECEGVVLIFDSLEQLAGDTPQAREVRDSIRTVFFHLADFLKIPCHAIYTVPPWVSFLTGIETSWKKCQFAMCRLWKRSSEDDRDESGLDAMRQFINKRIPLAEVFGTENNTVHDEIIFTSGGYMRDVLRMLQEFILKIGQDDPLPLPAARQQKIWSQVRQNFIVQYQSPVFSDHFGLLRRIEETQQVRLENEEEINLLGSFLDAHFVLCYMDDRGPYYRLHPLVKDLIPSKAP